MNILHLRKLINLIDTMTLYLLRARQIAVTRVAQYKERNGLPTMDPGREREHIASLSAKGNRVGLPEVITSEVFTVIMDSSRAHQDLQRGNYKMPSIDNSARCIPCGWRTAGIQGPPGSTKRLCPKCRRPLAS